MCYSLSGIICTLVKRMCKIVRIAKEYYNYNMAGVEAIIIQDESLCINSVLLGFPLDSPFGWYDSDYSTEYRCWWISPKYLEPITTITRSKFK